MWCQACFTFRIQLTPPPHAHNPSPCGVSVRGALILQPWDTMSLIKADLGSVCVRARPSGLTRAPQQSRPLSSLHEPLHWRAKRDPKAKCFLCSHFYGRAFLWAELGEIKTYRTLSGLYPGRPRPRRQSRIERSKSLV